MRAVMDTKREAGQFIGAFAPYGYQKDPENKNRLFVDGPAAEVVRRIFEEYLAGQSMAGIARRLNQEGVLPPSRYKAEIQRLPYHNANAVQGVWRAETIRTILGNPTYAGDLAQGKNEKWSYKLKASHKVPRQEWTVVPDTHEAIIDKEAFQIVQQLLERRSGHCKTKAHSHLLSGLVFCGDCGRPMTFCRRSSGRSFVLICSGYSRYGECQRHTTDEAQLERTVLERLNGFAKQVLPSGVEEALLQSCSGRNEALWMQEKHMRRSGSIRSALFCRRSMKTVPHSGWRRANLLSWRQPTGRKRESYKAFWRVAICVGRIVFSSCAPPTNCSILSSLTVGCYAG